MFLENKQCSSVMMDTDYVGLTRENATVLWEQTLDDGPGLHLSVNVRTLNLIFKNI